ncbi:hypothetical protein SCG7086_CA_00050 [Chlamydiales bacterium SCGC AG-110-P3]|nr:hypothetical protein SCG7086_CA_00050 [Chlamydiales bacterium SCGC AG-110-P3]
MNGSDSLVAEAQNFYCNSSFFHPPQAEPRIVNRTGSSFAETLSTNHIVLSDYVPCKQPSIYLKPVRFVAALIYQISIPAIAAVAGSLFNGGRLIGLLASTAFTYLSKGGGEQLDATLLKVKKCGKGLLLDLSGVGMSLIGVQFYINASIPFKNNVDQVLKLSRDWGFDDQYDPKALDLKHHFGVCRGDGRPLLAQEADRDFRLTGADIIESVRSPPIFDPWGPFRLGYAFESDRTYKLKSSAMSQADESARKSLYRAQYKLSYNDLLGRIRRFNSDFGHIITSHMLDQNVFEDSGRLVQGVPAWRSIDNYRITQLDEISKIGSTLKTLNRLYLKSVRASCTRRFITREFYDGYEYQQSTQTYSQKPLHDLFSVRSPREIFAPLRSERSIRRESIRTLLLDGGFEREHFRTDANYQFYQSLKTGVEQGLFKWSNWFGLNESYTPADLKKTARKFVRAFHPDRNTSPNAEGLFKLLQPLFNSENVPVAGRQ